MKFGYIRLSRAGPSLDAQIVALRRAGIPPAGIRVDDHTGGPPYPFEERALLIYSLKPGDELAVAAASRLGVGLDDVLGVLSEVARRGASVFEADKGRRLAWHPDAAEVVDFAREASKVTRLEVVAKMQRRRQQSDRLGGPRQKLDPERMERARRLWLDPSIPGQDIASEMQVSVRTLYRHFGERF